MRDIVGYIIFFTIGLVCAGAYFYQLHPEHSIEGDLPRLKRDVEDVWERGKRIRDAWQREQETARQDAEPESPSDTEPAAEQSEHTGKAADDRVSQD